MHTKTSLVESIRHAKFFGQTSTMRAAMVYEHVHNPTEAALHLTCDSGA